MNSIQIPVDELDELISNNNAQKLNISPWRHGYKETWIVPYNSKFYRIIIPVHSEEGWQLFEEEIKGVEVIGETKQITVTEWKEV